MTVIVRAEFQVSTGDRDAFLAIAAQLAAHAAEEPGTLQYRWFVGNEPPCFVVLEEYADEAAALEHNRLCEALLRELSTISEMSRVDIHGVLSREFAQWVDERAFAHLYPPVESPVR